jgi:hypothetical protein
MKAPAVLPPTARPSHEGPEHNGDRRRFLIFALMAGLVPPERVTERILQEVDSETSDDTSC